jgi:coenzyme F420-0:L-glutamate ligase/coenzyme F420-1:gamma-L-glutamate ligase
MSHGDGQYPSAIRKGSLSSVAQCWPVPQTDRSQVPPPEPLQLFGLADFPLVQAGNDLAALITQSLQHNELQLMAGDILVLAQKVVSKAEGRHVMLTSVVPTAAANDLAQATGKDPRVVELILQESSAIARARPGLVISEHQLGFVMANAGIDQSNVDQAQGEQVLLLPVAPDQSAAELRNRVGDAAGVPIGLIINDSWGRPWRQGTVGHAIGYAGVHGLADLVGQADLHGRALESSVVAWADELAAAASFIMGQAAEACPVVLVRGAAEAVGGQNGAAELLRPAKMDLFKDWSS